MENPDKTTNPKSYAKEDMTEQDGQGLSDVISYAVNSEKRSGPTMRIAPSFTDLSAVSTVLPLLPEMKCLP